MGDPVTALFVLVAVILGLRAYYARMSESNSDRLRSTSGNPNGGNMPEKRVSKSVYSITEQDANITVASDPAPGAMGEILQYKVPRHTKIHLRPEDYFYMTGTDTATTAIVDATPWELKLEDPNGITSEILRNGVYGEVKTVGDATKRFLLGIYKVIEDDFIIKLNMNTTTVTADASTVDIILTCLREAETLS